MPTRISDGVLSWATNLDVNAHEQAKRTARLPFVENPVALMPDAHLGMGATVGSVIATHGAIIPSAVGVDIGCGMIAARLPATSSDLPDSLLSTWSAIERVVPAGIPRKGDKLNGSHRDVPVFPAAGEVALAHLLRVDAEVDAAKAAHQMGTLGSGNHFVELTLDEADGVWLVLHSGSRGVGNAIARHHIEEAKGLMKRYFIDLEDKDLAYLVQGTAEFESYINDLIWAQDYAAANREVMLSNIIAALEEEWGRHLRPEQRINCHHNYTECEHHHGRNLWVTRKGAIRARIGDWGVIPGSMATGSFIVRGLGSDASYHSASHGAGRRLSRSAARRVLSAEDLAERMDGIAWNLDPEGLLDEHPAAYKDLGEVMSNQADLVAPVHHLTTILNFKGA